MVPCPISNYDHLSHGSRKCSAQSPSLCVWLYMSNEAKSVNREVSWVSQVGAEKNQRLMKFTISERVTKDAS